MGDEAAAKKDKTVAKRNFTRAHRELCEAIDDDDDEELVKEKYGLLTKKWANIQENYESWMKFQADYDDEEVERDEIWLNGLERMKIMLMHSRIKRKHRGFKKVIPKR